VNLRFSLRTLVIVLTVLAVVLAFIGTLPHVALGALVFALLILRSASGILSNFAEAWPEFKTSKVAKGLDGTRARMKDESPK
jgi:predicted tellurium resistance membrane protein TerC